MLRNFLLRTSVTTKVKKFEVWKRPPQRDEERMAWASSNSSIIPAQKLHTPRVHLLFRVSIVATFEFLAKGQSGEAKSFPPFIFWTQQLLSSVFRFPLSPSEAPPRNDGTVKVANPVTPFMVGDREERRSNVDNITLKGVDVSEPKWWGSVQRRYRDLVGEQASGRKANLNFVGRW
ncbi:hypothetical protein CPB83DRAFT_883763 [Crepidotus variabilis]|uniref:Uncharacterized protein n=1 Tax=Crepidotus variabilis TaxID=179855 RepID=A0A9P6EES4_9AGAR|nr:hypothetical protein CPB83DRAFT_883763 [Crepidotus variabilis]